MQQSYLLPSEHQAIPLSSLRHHNRSASPPLRAGDPAVCVMTDFEHEAVLTVTEETEVELALDAMFRLGVRFFLVMRDRAVVGVLSIQEARRGAAACGTQARDPRHVVRVAEVMVPCTRAPAVDWAMLQQWSIGDVTEIFLGCQDQYLVVLEDYAPARTRVRGLITRDRVERRLESRVAE